MKKIAFIMPQLCGGGAERVTAALVNEICREPGIQVHMIVYRHADTDYPLDSKVQLHSLEQVIRSSGHSTAAKIVFLRRLVKQIGADCAVSLAGPSMAAVLTVALLGSGVPLILSERNDPERYPRERLFRVSRLLSYSLCQGVVFQTGQARDYFPGWIRKKGTVISNPVTDALPARYEGGRDKRIVNWCRLNPQKNLELLIDAFSAVCPEFPDYTLCIYGEGGERKLLEKKIRDYGLEEKVLLPGHSHNIYEEVQTASLFVSSSDYEGISNSMLEAMALGIPTICTDCPAGGARETIEDGVNGLLVPVGDSSALAAAMKRVLSSPKLARSLGQKGEKLRQTLSSAAIAGRWLNYIGEVTGKDWTLPKES